MPSESQVRFQMSQKSSIRDQRVLGNRLTRTKAVGVRGSRNLAWEDARNGLGIKSSGHPDLPQILSRSSMVVFRSNWIWSRMRAASS